MISRTPTTPAGLEQTLHLVNFLAKHKLVKRGAWGCAGSTLTMPSSIAMVPAAL